jgi:hypothetical protein
MATNKADELWLQARDADKRGGRTEASLLFRRIIAEHPNSEAAKDAHLYFASEPHLAQHAPPAPIQLVRVVELDISFGNMMLLFIKAAFAIIPAAIAVAVVWTLVSGVVLGVLSGVR